jgi:hypothetical protein
MFDPWSPRILPSVLDDETLGELLGLFVAWNVRYLLAHPETPLLYESGARYLDEPTGEEVWRTIPHVLANGGSVCHSLACYRAAELRVGNILAEPVWDVTPLEDGTFLYHVQVYVPDSPGRQSSIEDPSLLLGMNASSGEGYPLQ